MLWVMGGVFGSVRKYCDLFYEVGGIVFWRVGYGGLGIWVCGVIWGGC